MSNAGFTLRNTFFSSVALWTEFLLGMVVSIIVARALQPDLYGHFSFMMWCATVFVIFGNGGLSTGVIKFIAEDGVAGMRHAVKRYLLAMQWRFLLVTTLVALTVGVLFHGFLLQTAGTSLWALLLLASITKAAYIFRLSASKGREQFGAIARVMLIVGPLNLAANAIVAWLSPGLAEFLGVYLFTSMAYLFFMRIFEEKEHGTQTLTAEHRRRIHHHVWLTSASIVLSFLILRQSEVFFLRLFAPAADIGFFNIAFTLGFALSSLIPGAYSALLLPMMARESRLEVNARGDSYRTSLRYLQLLAFPMVFGTWVLGRPLILSLYGRPYEPSSDVLLWVITGVGVAAVAQAAVGLLVSSDRQGRVLANNVIVMTALLAIDWWAIGRWGLAGAGPAFLAGNTVYACLMLSMAGRQLGVAWQWGDTLRTLAAGALPCLVTLAWLRGPANDFGNIAALASGTILFTLCYTGSTFLFHCWKKDELLFMNRLCERLPSVLATPSRAFIGRFL